MTSGLFSSLARVVVILLAMFAVSACTPSDNSTSETLNINKSRTTISGEIYLFKGLANVFSKGMDVIGEKLVARGLNAKVYNHSSWRTLADDIIARSKKRQVSYPVIIMGHSLGGNATMQMSKYLGDNGVKVAYAVSFDPTITTFVGPNVGEVLNYYLPNSDKTNIVREDSGFTGSLRNLDVSGVEGVTHVTVEKNARFQANVIKTTMALVKTRRPVATEIADVDQR